MARQRDSTYSAVRRLDVARFMLSDEHIGMAMILSALNEMNSELRAKMQRAGHYPNPATMPELVLELQTKGGPGYGPTDREDRGTAKSTDEH